MGTGPSFKIGKLAGVCLVPMGYSDVDGCRLGHVGLLLQNCHRTGNLPVSFTEMEETRKCKVSLSRDTLHVSREPERCFYGCFDGTICGY